MVGSKSVPMGAELAGAGSQCETTKNEEAAPEVRQEHRLFEASLGLVVRLHLKEGRRKKKNIELENCLLTQSECWPCS